MDSYLAHHGIPGQKWGVRRYQNYDGTLTPAGRERYGESKQLASQLFEKAKAHEPRITKDVMDSVNGTSAKMYGLEHKLKTEESLTRKIRTDSEEKNITPFDAASDIKDGVRYTALSPDNDFTSNYYKIKGSLEKKGYSEVRCKNYFDLYRQGQVKHKSVQSVFQSDDGYLFEMQFQTPASQDAKDKKVPIYEERRKPGLSKERQEALERQMVELAENVPDPKDVYKIKTHSGVKHSLGGDSMSYDELVHTLFAEDHLEHHGILGMKWGVRRYQNEDGTLTPAGRERYEKLTKNSRALNLNGTNATEAEKKAYGIVSKEGYDVIKKGASIQRIANSGEILDNKRKYVSILPDDNNDYYEMWDLLGADASKNIDKYVYETKKDLKVAQAKEVYNFIADKYGNGAVKRFDEMDSELKYLSLSKGIDPNFLYGTDKKLIKNICNAYDEGYKTTKKFIKDSLYANKSISDDVMKHFEKAGYDAIIDLEDSYGGGGLDYPVIVLNPKKSMKLVSTENIWDSEWYERDAKHSEGGSAMTYDELVHSLFAESPKENDLEHHGILGMKWGVRRYQNEDGSLTPAGRERYQKGLAKEVGDMYRNGKSAATSQASKDVIRSSKTVERCVKAVKELHNYEDKIISKAKTDKSYAQQVADPWKKSRLAKLDKQRDDYDLRKEFIESVWEDSSWVKDGPVKDSVLQSILAEYSNIDKKYSELWKESIEAQSEWEKEYPKLVKETLGKHGNAIVYGTLENGVSWDTTVSKFLGSSLLYAPSDMAYDDELRKEILGHSLDEDDHLEHHGILGMKWYRRRFQNEDGSLTPAGRERYGVGEAREGSSDKPKKPGIVERHKQKKEEKRKAAEKAARVKRMQEGKAKKAEERKAAEEHEAAKQKALRSAKASEIMKYRDELTDQEMRDAVARIGWDEALRKKAKEENPDKLTKAMKVVDKYGKAAGSIATATENTTKMYNNIAKALNTFTGSDWPLVGDSKKDQNGSDNKDNINKSSKSNDDKKPSKKDKENFEKTMKEATKILGEAAKKVNEESKKQAKDKHDWTVDDKPASNSSSSSSSSDKGVFDTKFEYSDAKAEQAEQVGRDAVERYLQLEDKRKG